MTGTILENFYVQYKLYYFYHILKQRLSEEPPLQTIWDN